MTMTSPPAEFMRAYRLFLRASSASVLHHGQSKRSLQRLYRPSFDAAAGALRQLQGLNNFSPEAIRLRTWLARFDNEGDWSTHYAVFRPSMLRPVASQCDALFPFDSSAFARPVPSRRQEPDPTGTISQRMGTSERQPPSEADMEPTSTQRLARIHRLPADIVFSAGSEEDGEAR